MAETCETCEHWTFDREEPKGTPGRGNGEIVLTDVEMIRVGVCRRFPPTPVVFPAMPGKIAGTAQIRIESMSPTTTGDAPACGEHWDGIIMININDHETN